MFNPAPPVAMLSGGFFAVRGFGFGHNGRFPAAIPQPNREAPKNVKHPVQGDDARPTSL
jgi:hypothetical protein